MSSYAPPAGYGPDEDARADLLLRLYARLVSRHAELQRHGQRELLARAARAEWHLLRRQLGQRVVAAGELLDRLATMAFMARSGHPLRVLFTGPPGAGKSHVAGALADVIGGRTVKLDAMGITEAGWSGVSLQEALGAAGGAEQLVGAVLIVEEVDKFRIHPQAHGNAPDKYRNQQGQWLPILDRAGRITLGAGSLLSRDLHVLMTGAFADAPWAAAGHAGTVSRDALIGYGLLPELVDRIDNVIVLAPPSVSDLARILRHEIEGLRPNALQEAVAELGFTVFIDPSVYAYLARALRQQRTTGTRAGRAVIEEALQRAVASAMRNDLPPDRVLLITPDDIQLPPTEEPPPGGRGERGGPGRRPVLRR